MLISNRTQRYVYEGKENGDLLRRSNMAGFIIAGAPAAGLPHPMDSSKVRDQAVRKGATPMPTNLRNAFQGIGMASLAQAARLGLTSSFKAGSGKNIK